MQIFHNEWDILLESEMQKPYYLTLREFLKHEYSTQIIYPPMQEIYTALRLVPYSAVRVVILGQDPYHSPNTAHGLAFSDRSGAVPPSLKNIYKEILSDTGIDNTKSGGNLTCWAEQGVLLLNTVLTVRQGQAGSHRGQGWETFTDEIIRLLNLREDPIVFLLWGNHAKAKKSLISNPIHLILESAHPSPLSAKNFFGCQHFSKCNAFLQEKGFSPIDWSVK